MLELSPNLVLWIEFVGLYFGSLAGHTMVWSVVLGPRIDLGRSRSASARRRGVSMPQPRSVSPVPNGPMAQWSQGSPQWIWMSRICPPFCPNFLLIFYFSLSHLVSVGKKQHWKWWQMFNQERGRKDFNDNQGRCLLLSRSTPTRPWWSWTATAFRCANTLQLWAVRCCKHESWILSSCTQNKAMVKWLTILPTCFPPWFVLGNPRKVFFQQPCLSAHDAWSKYIYIYISSKQPLSNLTTMHFFNVFQRFQRTETRWDARWDAVKDTSGLMKGAADSLQAGVLLKTRVVTCGAVSCLAEQFRNHVELFSKELIEKKTTFWTSELTFAESSVQEVFLLLCWALMCQLDQSEGRDETSKD